MDDYNEELTCLLNQANLIMGTVPATPQVVRELNEMKVNVLLDLVHILCRQHEGIDTVQLAHEIVAVLERTEEQR